MPIEAWGTFAIIAGLLIAAIRLNRKERRRQGRLARVINPYD